MAVQSDLQATGVLGMHPHAKSPKPEQQRKNQNMNKIKISSKNKRSNKISNFTKGACILSLVVPLVVDSQQEVSC